MVPPLETSSENFSVPFTIKVAALVINLLPVHLLELKEVRGRWLKWDGRFAERVTLRRVEEQNLRLLPKTLLTLLRTPNRAPPGIPTKLCDPPQSVFGALKPIRTG